MVDTFETATNWNNIDEQMQQMQEAVQTSLSDEGEEVMAFTHISHVYKQGASLYTTYFFRAGKDHASTLARWQKIKHAASLSPPMAQPRYRISMAWVVITPLILLPKRASLAFR